MSQELKGTYKVFENVHELISGIWPTPLVKLSKFGNVWAKLEYYNALSQSIKDRFAWYVINKLIKSGELTNKVIYEASSGNFALALALLSKIYNFNLRIYLPKSTSRSVEILLKILGVDYVKTDFEVINQDFRNYVRKISEISQLIDFFFKKVFSINRGGVIIFPSLFVRKILASKTGST